MPGSLLKDCDIVADVCSRHDPRTASEASHDICHNVAIEIRRHHNIKLVRPACEARFKVGDTLSADKVL